MLSKRKFGPEPENFPPQVVARVSREVSVLARKPPDGVMYDAPNNEKVSEIQLIVAGPEGTPYEGGLFRIKLVLGPNYPQAPPLGYFLTKIFHPNVSANGEICVNTLKRDWSADVTLSHVAQVVRCLLVVPFPESSLNDEAGKLFMSDYDDYFARAAVWTRVHANNPRETCVAGAASGGGGGASGAMGSVEYSPAVKQKVSAVSSNREAACTPEESVSSNGVLRSSSSSSSSTSNRDGRQDKSSIRKKLDLSPDSASLLLSPQLSRTPPRSKDEKLREKHKQAKQKGLKRL